MLIPPQRGLACWVLTVRWGSRSERALGAKRDAQTLSRTPDAGALCEISPQNAGSCRRVRAMGGPS